MTTATLSDECRAVAAVLRVAARHPHEQRVDGQVVDLDDEDVEGLRIARDHGVSPERLSAYRSLGQSRGLPLGDVLRACFRGELRMVVELPTVERGRRRGPLA